MDINDILNKEGFATIVINELKSYGVKYKKGKKKKFIQSKTCRKHIFRTHIHLLELTDVILASGKVVQIPKFVADSCNRILEQVETEGLFRKAGSFARQREIRLNLEAGIVLGKTNHVIDVANVVKYFFRELPEPLIPPNIQETFLQSFLIGENYINAILLSCLLLPTLTINTLSFFMQFLYTVSLNESYNKMSIENLAIIFTPGIMPHPNINSHRFSNHVKIISILIKYSTSIGVIPHCIQTKIEQSSSLCVTEPSAVVGSISECELNNFPQNKSKECSLKKKKKRRSDMFNGLKRIVGTAMGSSEFLDHTQSENQDTARNQITRKSLSSKNNTTPCIKEIKQRKIVETMSAISTKKKSTKQTHLSFGSNQHNKQTSLNPVFISMERRWSIVGSGWSKTKKNIYNNNTDACNREVENNTSGEQNNDTITSECFLNNTKIVENSSNLKHTDMCVEISKNDYEDIKERVAAIEFTVFDNSIIADKLRGPEQVQTQYERIIERTEDLSSNVTEHLAQRVNGGLKIRQSIDHCVIRSPSARKIGTIRRRSLDKTRLSRNSTCNVRPANILYTESQPCDSIANVSPLMSLKSFNSKSNVSTFKISQKLSLSPSHSGQKQDFKSTFTKINDDFDEQWMPGVDFFNSVKTKRVLYKGSQDYCNRNIVASPVKRKKNLNLNNTPIIPPRPCTKNAALTPLTCKPTGSNFSINQTEECTGRASIARLRTQNAGVVMAKAKLFNDLECHTKKFQALKNNENNSKTKISNKRFSGENQKSLFTDSNTLLIEPNTNILQSKTESTPIARRIQNINLNSPVSSPKRRRPTNVRKLF